MLVYPQYQQMQAHSQEQYLNTANCPKTYTIEIVNAVLGFPGWGNGILKQRENAALVQHSLPLLDF